MTATYGSMETANVPEVLRLCREHGSKAKKMETTCFLGRLAARRTGVACVSPMPVREFTDESGREWRAWDIKPHEIHPATKAEDYLAECYITGWIVFETISGDEKRRLCPWPISWIDESEQGLRKLLSMAEVVPHHRSTSQRASGEWEARAVANDSAARLDEPDITDLQVVRTFTYPGGRVWVASVVRSPEDADPLVLRFMAGARSIDLRKWRKDWAEQPDETLISMLRRAAPRGVSGEHDVVTPRRRWDDQSESGT